MEELRQLQANVKLMPNPDRPGTGDQICMAHYPLDADPDILYGPKDSNSDKLKAASTSLYKRFHHKGLLVDFHREVVKSVEAGHMVRPTQSKSVPGIQRGGKMCLPL